MCKIKIYPSFGDIYYVLISEELYDNEEIDEWIEDNLKNVEEWQYA